MHHTLNSPNMKYLIVGACWAWCIAAILAKPFQMNCNPCPGGSIALDAGRGMPPQENWGAGAGSSWNQLPWQNMPMQGGSTGGMTLEQYALQPSHGYSGHSGVGGMPQFGGGGMQPYGQYGGMQPMQQQPQFTSIPLQYGNMQHMQPMQHQPMGHGQGQGYQFMNYRK